MSPWCLLTHYYESFNGIQLRLKYIPPPRLLQPKISPVCCRYVWLLLLIMMKMVDQCLSWRNVIFEILHTWPLLEDWPWCVFHSSQWLGDGSVTDCKSKIPAEVMSALCIMCCCSEDMQSRGPSSLGPHTPPAAQKIYCGLKVLVDMIIGISKQNIYPVLILFLNRVIFAVCVAQ